MCGIGIESFVRKPVTTEVLLPRVAKAIANPQRFISSLTYFGPDRRRPRAPDAPYLGLERRRQIKRKDSSRDAAVIMPNDVRRAISRSSPDGEAGEGVEAGSGEDAAPESSTPARRSAARHPPRVEGDDGDWLDPPPDAGPTAAQREEPPDDDPAPLAVPSPPPRPGRAEPKPAPCAAPAGSKPAAEAPPPDAAGEDGARAPASPGPQDKREKKVQVEPDPPAVDVAALVTDHAAWLNSGGQAGTKAALDGEDLTGIQIPGANFSSASFRRARTCGVRFCRAPICAGSISSTPTSAPPIFPRARASCKSQVNKDRVSENTTLPPGLRLPAQDEVVAGVKHIDFSVLNLISHHTLQVRLSRTQ